MDSLKTFIRDIPDFPKLGILYRDITPLLMNPDAFRSTVNALEERYAGMNITKIVAVESRGFIFASPLSYSLGAGFVPVRKQGKLPFDTIGKAYDLEYGKATLEIHSDAIMKGDRVVVFDDLLATGGTASASIALVEKLGGKVVEAGFVIELSALNGRAKLRGTPVFSLLQYD
ncbi:MAG: adenine phosphoribosyltransferase [bacterium]|nr:adenine phosphoribosyltransferase [bacterium]